VHPVSTQKVRVRDPTAITMALSVFIGFGMPLLEAALRETSIQTWMRVTGIALMLIGFSIGYSANRIIAKNWSPVIDKTQEQQLVKLGVYSVVRHPLYFSGVLLLMGTNVYFGNSWSWLSTLLVLVVTLYRIPIEEKQLASRFGQEYADYKRQTKALIPWIL
ncbi:MAG: isoprenylcysteine carboxylmethyltransferase family protein, partial [Desulfobacterales bacterium]|nr:isoprenylcysteine carboxylmethyltransferase family protein [Desulfobacterales bacterium]